MRRQKSCNCTSSKANSRLTSISLLSLLALLIQMDETKFGVVSVVHTGLGRLPQHRVRVSKLALNYGDEHPWRKIANDSLRRTNIQSYPLDDQDNVFEYKSRDLNVSTDDLKAPNQTDDFVSTGDSNSSTTNRLYKPIRIRASFPKHRSSGYHLLTEYQRKYLVNEILNPVFDTWSKALRVIPVQDSLKIDPQQLYDGVSCGPGMDSGLPSVLVPSKHFDAGFNNTDLIVYVSVGIVSNNNDSTDNTNLQKSSVYSKNSIQYLSQNGGFRGLRKATTNSTDNNQNFTPSQKYVPVPTSSPTKTYPSEKCTGEYLASATYCSTDQYDRPIAGIIHLCITPDMFFQESNLAWNKRTVLHEVGHILGFNSLSMAHFRDSVTGVPLTSRDASGNVPDVLVECTGVAKNRGYAMIPLPSDNTLQFKTVRGSIRVAEIVTKNVKQVVRNQFDCQSLTGAEIESEIQHPIDINKISYILNPETNQQVLMAQGTCIGDHWERRLFKQDIMNPILNDVEFSDFISPLTLAFFMDSGWYKVNTSRAAVADSWGRGAGCDFVNKQCILKSGQVSSKNAPFFCSSTKVFKSISGTQKLSTASIHGCNDDMTHKATCIITEYPTSLPSEFQYFSEKLGPNYGGLDSDLDYCPLFHEFGNGSCQDPEAAVLKVSSSEEFGVANSRCISGVFEAQNTALCLPVACVKEDLSLKVKLDGFWNACDYGGQIISSWWDESNYVVCPDPRLVCRAFYCPTNCLVENGAKVCDYDSGSCVDCHPLDWECNQATSNATTVVTDDQDGYYNGPSFDDYIDIDSSQTTFSEFYVNSTLDLIDDSKDIFDETARIFIKMEVGEILGVIACSVLVVCVVTIVVIYGVKLCKRESTGWSVTNLFNKLGLRNNMNWTTQVAYSDQQQNDIKKRETIAKMPGNSKMRSSTSQNSLLSSTSADENVVLLSKLPPLPLGVTRVLAVVGSTLVDDRLNDLDRTSILDDVEITASNSEPSGMISFSDTVSSSGLYDGDDDDDTQLEEFEGFPIINQTNTRRKWNSSSGN